MSRRSRRVVAAVGGTAILVGMTAVGLVSVLTPEAKAHGSTQVPASRVYACRFEQPENPMCARAYEANPQAIYDWMEVNIANADGRHRQLIPDGELCSAGRDKYAAFDEPGDWPVTRLTPNSSGDHEIVYTNTAPHATAYYRLMLTRPGFDARTDRLTWDDLEVVYESGALPPAPENRFTVRLPEREEPAILYVIWQRSDSPEAFYACSDLTIDGDGSPPGTTTTTPSSTTSSTTPPTTTEPPTTTTSPPDPGNPSSPVAGIEATARVTSSWDTGSCTEVRVENTTSSPLTWVVHYRPAGTVDSLWNAEVTAGDGYDVFTGESWNQQVPGGGRTTFGLCVTGG